MNYATWFARFGAYVIDTLVPAPLFLGAAIVDDGSGKSAPYLLLVVAGFLLSAYNRWYRAGKTGRSWGRQVVGIRLVAERTNQPVGVARAALRDVTHLVDSLPLYIGYLFPLWTRKRQTIADMVMRTVVLR